MKKILKIVVICAFLGFISFASQPRPGIISFTQPDGTKFLGVLKGDAYFNWIESNGDVIIYNPKDKFYHKAIVTDKITILEDKPKVASDMDILNAKTNRNKGGAMGKSTSSLKQAISSHYASKEDKEKLYLLYKKSRRNYYKQP